MNSEESQKCLTSLGMSEKRIAEYMQAYFSGDTPVQLRILNEFRGERVNSMHDIYKDLECIDYVIAQVKKREALK